MSQVIPGILEKDFAEIEKKLAIIKPFSSWVHIDFLDGKFSEESSFMDIAQFKKYKDDFSMEAHLMVDNPLQYMEELSDAGFIRIMGHMEKMVNVEEFVAQGQLDGGTGLALDIKTPIDSIKVPFDDLDLVLLMSVKAGKSGQDFDPEVLAKIASIREKNGIPVEVDGGINPETILDAKKAGASRFVATSFIFGSKNPREAYEKLVSEISSS